MARALTTDERAVLADVVLDPDAWWTHANSRAFRGNPEGALAEKVQRHRPAYQARLTNGAYKNRSERDAERR